ncbi:hypothetical protein SK128_005585 [Halocaridina rubra]|uniref:Uncharacterized protein n=1 Tax=Halocaridina rubra TaxID=373956 RepID=A0AAN9AH31_HALRR
MPFVAEMECARFHTSNMADVFASRDDSHVTQVQESSTYVTVSFLKKGRNSIFRVSCNTSKLAPASPTYAYPIVKFIIEDIKTQHFYDI